MRGENRCACVNEMHTDGLISAEEARVMRERVELSYEDRFNNL